MQPRCIDSFVSVAFSYPFCHACHTRKLYVRICHSKSFPCGCLFVRINDHLALAQTHQLKKTIQTKCAGIRYNSYESVRFSFFSTFISVSLIHDNDDERTATLFLLDVLSTQLVGKYFHCQKYDYEMSTCLPLTEHTN